MIGRILAAMRAAVPARIPVTLKMRVGWNDDALNGPEVARIAEASGAQAITVHGRTREQLYTGTVRLDAIRAVKEAVRVPVIGNGDILTPEDARAHVRGHRLRRRDDRPRRGRQPVDLPAHRGATWRRAGSGRSDASPRSGPSSSACSSSSSSCTDAATACS